MPNEAVENYLKAIYEIQRRSGKVTTSSLAKRLKVTPASVTGMIKKLADMKLLRYERYQGVRLNDGGRKIALEVIRHHRLIELFLAEALNVPWDKVHEEAEKWEHVLSEEMEDRIDAYLDYPTHDPHGSPIPDRNGVMPETVKMPLLEAPLNRPVIIVEVSDADADILRYLGDLGLYPQTRIMLTAIAPFEGPVSVTMGDEELGLGRKVCQHIYIRLCEDEAA